MATVRVKPMKRSNAQRATPEPTNAAPRQRKTIVTNKTKLLKARAEPEKMLGRVSARRLK
jgi:hypothetical protein